MDAAADVEKYLQTATYAPRRLEKYPDARIDLLKDDLASAGKYPHRSTALLRRYLSAICLFAHINTILSDTFIVL